MHVYEPTATEVNSTPLLAILSEKKIFLHSEIILCVLFSDARLQFVFSLYQIICVRLF